MKIRDLIAHLEEIAPLNYQESYDNSGLIVGDVENEIKGVIVCLDSIEEVVEEAIEKNCNVIVAHHPIVFSGLKKITGKNYIERTVLKAIKNNIAIYAIHTNLDNVLSGVNAKIAEKLNLINTKILSPVQNDLRKLVTYAPMDVAKKIRLALFNSGAGSIGNYSHCSFNTEGEGTFLAGEGTSPFVGNIGEIHTERETRIEVVYPKNREDKIVSAMLAAHPYEEVAYDILLLGNKNVQFGAGIIGELEEGMAVEDFLRNLKKIMKTDCIRYTNPVKKKIKKVALCGGSGSFLLGNAMSKEADIFISGDFKYHQFFDAENKIIIADIGHFESEQFTIELLADVIKEKFTIFAVHLTEINTNPINYL